MSTDYVPWLRMLALKGGKGVVNNVDARSLDRIAEEITKLRAERYAAAHAAAQSMRERCAKVARRSYSLMFPKPRNRITAENAGHAVADAILTLPDIVFIAAELCSVCRKPGSEHWKDSPCLPFTSTEVGDKS